MLCLCVRAFQQHALDVFLSRDLSNLVNDISGTVTAEKINIWMQLTAELITDPALKDHLEGWLEVQLNQMSGLSVSDFLTENGVDVSGTELEEIKSATTEVLTSAMLNYLGSEAGKAWVNRLLD